MIYESDDEPAIQKAAEKLWICHVCWVHYDTKPTEPCGNCGGSAFAVYVLSETEPEVVVGVAFDPED